MPFCPPPFELTRSSLFSLLPLDAWWRVEELEELRGNVLVQCEAGSYVIALDDGTLTVSGEQAENVPGPTAQEVITIVSVSAARVALKSAFNRYVSVNADASNPAVVGRQEAVGTMELFEPVAREDVSLSVCFVLYESFSLFLSSFGILSVIVSRYVWRGRAKVVTPLSFKRVTSLTSFFLSLYILTPPRQPPSFSTFCFLPIHLSVSIPLALL